MDLLDNQQELFAEYNQKAKKPERLPMLAKPAKTFLITATSEQLIFWGILAILILCGVFFLGVLRGGALKNNFLRTPAQTAREVPVPQIQKPEMRGLPQRAAPKPALLPAPTLTVKSVTEAGTALLAKKIVVLGPAAGKKIYTLQLVTHKKKELAESEVQAVRKSGRPSFIIPSGDFYQVCVGEYATRDEAKRDLTLFKSKYPDCFLRRR